MNLVNNPEKTLLVGHGYWGKIIEKNLKNKPMIVDIQTDKNYQLEKFLDSSTHVIIATPASSHYEILSKALERDCKIFCEKPLTVTHDEAKKLYEKANLANKNFFVDWIFLNNPVIKFLKNNFGELFHASMNRLNSGPIRHDVSSAFDLSSHDLSILLYLVETNKNFTISHENFLSDKQTNSGTNFSKVSWDSGSATLYSSWNFPIKNRTCVFSFDDSTVHWDDFLGVVIANGKSLNFKSYMTPLQSSLESFFRENYNFEENKRITLEVSRLLQGSAG
jgi:predicted dehydrogenase